MTRMHHEDGRAREVVLGNTGLGTVEPTESFGGGQRPGGQSGLRGPDIFTLGVLANVVICLLGSYLFETNGANEWVDASSVTLLWLLGLENIAMLLLARRTNDPFVAILVGLTTVFYMGRVGSLLYDPFSIAFTFAGFPISSDHVNATLRLVLWGNLAVFVGVTAAKVRRVATGGAVGSGMASRLAIALAVVYATNFFLGTRIGALGRVAAGVLQLTLHSHMVLLMAMTFLLMNRKRRGWLHLVVLRSMLAMFVLLTTVIGSRSGVLVLVILGLCALLAAQKRFEVRWSWLVGSIVVLPLAITAFNIATLVRLSGYKPGVAVSAQRVAEVRAVDVREYGSIKSFIRPVADRMGYLDYATVMVAGAEHYATVVNVEYYLKSLVDNLLSPGFDVYDTPKASLTLRFLPTSDIPSLALAREDYSSSQLTAYGEMYVLLPRFWPLVGLGFMGYAFARFFARIRAKDDYHLYLYRAVVLLAFHNWLNSFGLDWMVIEATTWVVTLLVFERVVVGWGGERSLRAGASAPVAASEQTHRMRPRPGGA